MQEAYAAIGRAVFFAQLFETALIPIVEGFKMHNVPGYLEKTEGYISAGTYMAPIMNVIKALSAGNSIPIDLEERLRRYVKNRNALIHSSIRDNGLPEENDAEGFSPYIQLANQVEAEAKQLTQIFAGYLIKIASPEHAHEYEEAMAHFFHRAHIDEEK